MSEWKIVIIDPPNGEHYLAAIYRPNTHSPASALVGHTVLHQETSELGYKPGTSGGSGFEIWDLDLKKDESQTPSDLYVMVNSADLPLVSKAGYVDEKTEPRITKVSVVSGGGSNNPGNTPGKPGSTSTVFGSKHMGSPRLLLSIELDVKGAISKIKPDSRFLRKLKKP